MTSCIMVLIIGRLVSGYLLLVAPYLLLLNIPKCPIAIHLLSEEVCSTCLTLQLSILFSYLSPSCSGQLSCRDEEIKSLFLWQKL